MLKLTPEGRININWSSAERVCARHFEAMLGLDAARADVVADVNKDPDFDGFRVRAAVTVYAFELLTAQEMLATQGETDGLLALLSEKAELVRHNLLAEMADYAQRNRRIPTPCATVVKT
jgi:hypothetical protein